MRSQLRLDERGDSVNYKHKPSADAWPAVCVLLPTLTKGVRDATVHSSAIAAGRSTATSVVRVPSAGATSARGKPWRTRVAVTISRLSTRAKPVRTRLPVPRPAVCGGPRACGFQAGHTGPCSRAFAERELMQLTGAEIVIRCLQEEAVEYVFGYPGGAGLNIYDELFKQEKVKHVLVRHEQGAVHAADGYSRSSHKVGVALVTSGPGVTNAVTGIATAYMDSVPLVIISGQVPTHAIGQDAFQECDTVGITRPCVKHNFLVKDVKDIAITIKKAFYLAASGRPGPVLVDIPKDVTQALAEYSYPKTVSLRSYNPVTKGHAGQIKKAGQSFLGANRPWA